MRRVLNDRHQSFELVRVELARSGAHDKSGFFGQECSLDTPLVKINIGLFADNIRVSPADTLDLRQSVHDLALAINVRVKQTQNVLPCD